jgi:hypothetical protein
MIKVDGSDGPRALDPNDPADLPQILMGKAQAVGQASMAIKEIKEPTLADVANGLRVVLDAQAWILHSIAVANRAVQRRVAQPRIVVPSNLRGN